MGCLGDFRGYPELMYSGALTHEQAAHLFAHLAYGNDSRLVTRPMTLACTGYNNKQVRPAPTTREQYSALLCSRQRRTFASRACPPRLLSPLLAALLPSQPPGPTALPSWQSTYTAYGFAYGLLVYDMVEPFLLHYFGMSAHT